MPRYVALLRGINVGGNNLIKMSDLKAAFEAAGFTEVATYIQSGNVLFNSPERSASKVSAKTETALHDAFRIQHRVVVRSHAQLRSIVARAPTGFGTQPDEYRYDVVFLRPPLTATAALKDLRARDGVDQVFAGDGVCYFSRLTSRATQSYLSRIISLPAYQSMTIRNWNTTTKLLALMEAQTAKGDEVTRT